MKIKFNYDGDLPWKKPLTFYAMIITIRSIFDKEGKFFPQVLLDDALYELRV